ncbi:hypothetical protein DMENIID0001_029120 [Sergentomyia squamirostris]
MNDKLHSQPLFAVVCVVIMSHSFAILFWQTLGHILSPSQTLAVSKLVQRPVDIKNRPRIPIPDEDPYSVAGNGGSGGSSSSSGFGASGGGGHVAATREQLLLQTQQLASRRSEKPPKLPPRDNMYPHDIPKFHYQPDYDDIEDDTRVKSFARGKSDKGKDNKKYDDPYYCGLRARVPNFVKTSKAPPTKHHSNGLSVHEKETPKRMSLAHLQHPTSLQSLHQLHQMHPHQHLMAAHQQQQMMWHARSFESGIGIYRHSRYMPDCDNQTPPSHVHHHPSIYRTPSISSVAPHHPPYSNHYSAPTAAVYPDYQPQSLQLERIQSFRQVPDMETRAKIRRKKSLKNFEEWYDDSSSNAGEETRASFYIPKPKIMSTHSNPLVVADPFGSVPVVSHPGYWIPAPGPIAYPSSRKWPSENDLFPTLKRQHTFRGVPTPNPRILAEEVASQKCEADFSTGDEDISVDSVEKVIQSVVKKKQDPVKYVTKIYLARQNPPVRKASLADLNGPIIYEPVLRKSMSSDSFFLRDQNPMGGDPDNTPDGSHEEPHKGKLLKVGKCPNSRPLPSRLPVRRLSLQQRPGSADGGNSELVESPYNHIYGRIPLPTRGYIPPPPRTMYIGEWD